MVLAESARTIANDDVIDLRLVAVFLVELLLSRSNKLLVKIVANQVDGATSKATAHDSGTSDTALLSNVVQEVKFLAGNLIVLGQSFVRLIHQLANFLVVAFIQCIANAEYAVFLAEHELGTLVVFFTDFGSYFVKLFPCAITQGLKFSFRVLGLDVLYHVLTRVAAVVVRRTCQLVLHYRVEQHEAITIGLEGEIFKLTAAAVKRQPAFPKTEANWSIIPHFTPQ